MTQNPWGRPTGQQQMSPWGAPTSRQQTSPWGAPAGRQQWGQSPWGQPMPGQQPVPVFGGHPPRRRNPLVTLLKVLIALGVLGFLGLMALGAVFTSVINSIDVPEPTTQPTIAQTDSPWDPDGDPGGSGAPAPSTPPTTTDDPAPAPAGGYQNDDYQVPPADLTPPALPEPETYEEATQLLRANPVYNSEVPRPVRCEMDELDLQRASRRQLTAHFNEMTACLMRVWEEPLAQAGFQAVRPSVTVYSGSVTSKCGKLPAQNAVYCGADQQVYYAMDLPRTIPASIRGSRFIGESVVAHEFGHAVQARTAILISEAAWEEKSNKATSNQLSRRLEVQADCLAGQFLGSIQQSTQMTQQELDNVTRLFYSIGDDVLTGRPNYDGNHGSGTNRQAWTRKGLASTQVGSCNSFAAPADQVR